MARAGTATGTEWKKKRAKAMTFLIHLFIISEIRSSLSVTGSILPLLLSVMAIRYSPKNSMNREQSTIHRTSNSKPKTSVDRQQSAFFFFPFQPAENLNGIEVSCPSRNPKRIHRPGSLALSESISADERRKFGSWIPSLSKTRSNAGIKKFLPAFWI